MSKRNAASIPSPAIKPTRKASHKQDPGKYISPRTGGAPIFAISMTTRPRQPTDTLIITGVSPATVRDPAPLALFLAQSEIELELVSLPKFGRIILLCKNSQDASIIGTKLAQLTSWCSKQGNEAKIVVSFSLQNNHWHHDTTAEKEVEYLELPLENESRRFLISPPLSPPPEWDHWHRTEEGPNRKTIPSPHELSHLLWERLGGFQGEEAVPYTEDEKEEKKAVNIAHEPEILFENVDNGVPVILLDAAPGNTEKTALRSIAKTAMPPMDIQ